MNYKLAMIPFLLAGMLASCDDNEELVQQNPEFVESGYGALTLTLKYPDTQTKAVGDPVDVAYNEEKMIKSVAFFVKTDVETVDGDDLAGSFGGYFSDEELLSAKGLQENLEETSTGVYTAKIRHRSDGWTNPEVMVIANYIENGLSEKLKDVLHWSELKAIVSETLTANPQTPLLMYATKEIAAWKSSGEGKGGGSAEESFEMKRLVSRIDIRNYAYNQTAPEQGFVLTSAQLIRPKTASYLMPELPGRAVLSVSSEPFPASGTIEEDGSDPVIQKIDSLYAYENDNADPATATAVQIIGTFRGGRISKVIDFKKADGVDKTGDPIALARNNRYVVNLNAAPDSTDITWNIVVKEWNESDTIKVKPIYNKPVFSDIVTDNIGEAQWDEGTKTLDITNVTSTGGTFTFKTIGTTASVYKLAYAYDADASSVDGDPTEIVTAHTPIISYAASIETPFTINIPKQKDSERVPLDIYVIIQNGGNENARDTITIKSRPNYADTNIKPVLMKGANGKKFFWAPVNIGATKVATSITEAKSQAAWEGLSERQRTELFEQCGYYFQWGRKTGLKMPVDFANNPDTATVSTVGWPTSQSALASFEEDDKWRNKFIPSGTTDAHGRNTQNNWLLFTEGEDNPTDGSMENSAWYQCLWDANVVAGDEQTTPSKTTADPCPEGWRVPTFAEWKLIGAGNKDVTKVWDSSNHIMTIDGVDGDKLVLPAAGNRNSGAGYSINMGSYGNYWSSSVPKGSSYASRVYFLDETLGANGYHRAAGFSVRCVQE